MHEVLARLITKRGGLRRALAGLGAVAVLTAVTARAGDEPTLPAAWQGVWSMESIDRICGDSTIIDQQTSVDTLCAGDPFYAEEAQVSCTGTVDDQSADITCSFTQVIDEKEFPGCTVTFTFHLEAQRTSATTLSALETLTIDYSEECPVFFEDSCTETTTTGTLLPGDPECVVPIEPGSWASIKSHYR